MTATITDTVSSGDELLSNAELLRYSRHLVLPEVGLEGQRRLKQARVLVVGAGGLGSPVALYLAAAGVGTIGLVDFDAVDETNLQRQILHGTSTIGTPKLDSAEARLRDLNPHVKLERFDVRLSANNALAILRGFDLVIDGTDNFGTRYLVNDACVLLGIPNVYGSIYRFEGQVSLFATKDGPCYRCLFRQPPPPGAVPNCAEGGVLGVLPGLVGTIQAAEAIKHILRIGSSLTGQLLLVDALGLQFRRVKVRKDPECPACGTRTIDRLVDEVVACEVPAPRGRGGVAEITPIELDDRLKRGDGLLLVDVRDPWEWSLARLSGARLVPLDTIADAAGSLPKDLELVLYCKGGVRSIQAALELQARGFERVTSLAGGIGRWREEVDPSLPRY
ncbi:MAG: molybdopterin-synthase adenylyltransferase MoeB [Gemmatimonadales bacterium]